jgi:hypothetical protein
MRELLNNANFKIDKFDALNKGTFSLTFRQMTSFTSKINLLTSLLNKSGLRIIFSISLDKIRFIIIFYH